MAQDYAKRKKPPAKKKSPGLPAWFWLLTGTVSGLFIAFLIYLSSIQLQQTKQAQNNQQINSVPQSNPLSDQIKEQAERLRQGKEALKKPTFTFYKRLPELIVETPKPDRITSDKEEKKSYLLQVGSFRSFQDADALKAQLIMQGLEVNVSSVKDKSDNDWHRVRVGPYSTQNKLNKAQDILANENIPSILMEAK